MSGAILRWRDLDDIPEKLFNVWVDRPELTWAEEAWEHLIRQGLAAHDNELEKLSVKIRFLALAGFYRDFCHIAWGETSNPMYPLWAEMMGISEVRVGQMVGNDPELNTEPDQVLFPAALEKLTRLARPQVVNALMTAYGSASGLLVSLWNSRNLHDWTQCPFGEEGCSDCKESADQIFNRNIEEKGPAYAWLDQGADEIL